MTSRFKKELKLLERFSFVGIFNTVLGYSLIFFLMFIGVGPYLSNALGYAVGFFISFLLNKHFVFRSKGRTSLEGLKFLGFMGIAYLLNFAVLHVLFRFSINAYLSQLLSGAIYSLSMYLFSRKWVFLSSTKNTVEN